MIHIHNCVCSYPQRQLRTSAWHVLSVSASRKDWLWKLQSNSCNYLQSVDNQGPAERLLAHKHGRGKEALRGMEGRISKERKENGSAWGCEKHVIIEITNEAAAGVNTNHTRKWQQSWLTSLKPLVLYKTFFSKTSIFFKGRKGCVS